MAGEEAETPEPCPWTSVWHPTDDLQVGWVSNLSSILDIIKQYEVTKSLRFVTIKKEGKNFGERGR